MSRRIPAVVVAVLAILLSLPRIAPAQDATGKRKRVRPDVPTKPGDPPRSVNGEVPDPDRKTSDGVAYPVLGDEKVKLELPLIGDALGNKPEAFVGGFEVLVQRQSNARIGSLFNGRNLDHGANFGPDGFEFPGDTLWTFGPARAAAVSFRLDQGRVTRVALHYPQLALADLKVIEAKFKPLMVGTPDDVTTPDRARMIGTRVKLAGNRTTKLPIPVWCTIWYRNVGGPQAPRDVCVVLQVDPVEWYLLYNKDVDTKAAEALRAGKPVKGMPREQVILCVRDYPHRQKPMTLADNKQGEVVEWTAWSEYWKDQRVAARATFDGDDKLIDFATWNVEAKDAPKPQ
jgi:hypothetical protein